MINEFIKAGKIVPVAVTLGLLKKAMERSGKELFLVDGFPRNWDNLQGWEAVMTGAAEVGERGHCVYCICLTSLGACLAVAFFIVARSRSHRGAAGRLGGGTNCWCGTAAAQQPAEGWCPTWVARLGVRRSASSMRVIRRAEALARRGRGHIREHLHGSGRHAYEEASCGCATCTSTWTVAVLAQRRACGVAKEATGVLCEHISRFQIPILVSRFTEAWQWG